MDRQARMTDTPAAAAPRTRKVAMIACPVCGERTELRLGAKKGRLYVMCQPPDGCGQQTFSRSLAADKRLAGRAENWTDPEARAALLGAGAPSAKPQPKGQTSWLDVKL
jgi:hypothetical protein